jgi:hypothetical protein
MVSRPPVRDGEAPTFELGPWESLLDLAPEISCCFEAC